MLRLYSAANLMEAHLVLHLLEQAGIGARVVNEYAQGAAGEIPAIPEIWLEQESDLTRARAVVARYESARAEPAHPAHRCHACGEENPSEFELCWHCSAAIEK